MDMKNVSPSPHESAERAAKWDAIGRIAVICTLPAIAFLGIVLKLAWHLFEVTAPALLLFFELAIVMLVAGGIYGLFRHLARMSRLKAERYAHNTYRFSPDTVGNYEALFDQEAKTFIQTTPGNYQQPVYQTYSPHYAPVFAYKDASQRVLPEPKEQEIMQANLAPTIEEVVTSLPRNGLQLSLGRSLTSGELLAIALPDSHIKLIGATRKGKSSLAAGLLEQVQRTHDPHTLQFALLDLEYKTSRLFERSPSVAYLQAGRRGRVPAIARSAPEVALWLRWLYQEMERRYRMSEQQLAHVPYLLVYIEEFLGLRRHLKANAALGEAITHFTLLATQGLKAKLSLMVCAQVDYSSEELRDAMAQFVGTNVAFSVKPDAARAAGFISTALLNRNYASKVPGQYVVEATGLTDLGVSPQFDVREKLKALADMGTGANPGASPRAYLVQNIEEMPAFESLAPAMHQERTRNAPEPLHQPAQAWQAYYEQVLTCYEQGYRNQDQIIEHIWHVKKGGNEKWYGYRDIVRRCLAAITEAESEG
jgi:FtsK/SpoIIIE family